MAGADRHHATSGLRRKDHNDRDSRGSPTRSQRHDLSLLGPTFSGRKRPVRCDRAKCLESGGHVAGERDSRRQFRRRHHHARRARPRRPIWLPRAWRLRATFTVSAVLQADGVTNGSATVTVSPPSSAQISVTPTNASVVEGTSLQFSAAVQNGPQAVIWQVNNIDGGNSTFGTVSSSGFYTAPSRIPNPPVATITALLATNSAISGSTSITIVAPSVSISISPSTANLATEPSAAICRHGAELQRGRGLASERSGRRRRMSPSAPSLLREAIPRREMFPATQT